MEKSAEENSGIFLQQHSLVGFLLGQMNLFHWFVIVGHYRRAVYATLNIGGMVVYKSDQASINWFYM